MVDSNGNGNGVRITNLRIFEILEEVRDTMAGVVIRNREADILHKDHEVRIKVLEVAEIEHRTALVREKEIKESRAQFWRWFVPASASVILVATTVAEVVHP